MKEQKTVNPGYSTKATTPFVNYFLFILPQQQDSDSFHQRIAPVLGFVSLGGKA